MPDKPEEHKREVANAIRAVDADIVALQEVGSIEALLWFRDEHLDGMGYDYVVSLDSGDSRGIEQSILSRFPVTSASVWPHLPLGGVHPPMYGDQPNRSAGEPLMGRRSPLLARVEVPGGAFGGAEDAPPYEMTLLVVHHKAGRWDGYWREAEARAFVARMREIERKDPGARIAVLGDFNAQMNEEPLWIYRDAGFHDVFHWSERSSKTLTHASERAIDFILVNSALRRDVVDNGRSCSRRPAAPRGDWRHAPPAGRRRPHARRGGHPPRRGRRAAAMIVTSLESAETEDPEREADRPEPDEHRARPEHLRGGEPAPERALERADRPRDRADDARALHPAGHHEQRDHAPAQHGHDEQRRPGEPARGRLAPPEHREEHHHAAETDGARDDGADSSGVDCAGRRKTSPITSSMTMTRSIARKRARTRGSAPRDRGVQPHERAAGAAR